MPSTSPPTLSITLVRHGETSWNEQRLVQGHNNSSSLTDRGRLQAEEVAKSLQELGFDHLVTSDLDRATETAAIIGNVIGLDTVVDPRLRERCFGALEGGPTSDLTGDLTGIVEDVIVDPDARPAGGESFREVVGRVGDFLNDVRSERSTQRVLVVTHGGTIRAFRAHVEGVPLEGMSWYDVDNCSVWDLYDTY